MEEPVAPCMDGTVDVDTLVSELEDHCPLQLNLWEESPVVDETIEDDLPLPAEALERLKDAELKLDIWKLPVQLPPPKRKALRPQAPVDLSPLFDFYEEHRSEIGRPIRWVYDYHYFEVLEQEGRLRPLFWVRRDEWSTVRGRHQLIFDQSRNTSVAERLQKWLKCWQGLLANDIVQWESPDSWLEMLALDEELLDGQLFVPESIYLRMIPVYKGVSAEDVRRLMVEDMRTTLMFIPDSDDDAGERWDRFAHRLGMKARWPSREAFLVEQREMAILRWVRQDLTPREVAEKLMATGLAAVRNRDEGPADFESVRRTVYEIIDNLEKRGWIRPEDVNRRRKGRPRKKPMT